ncbi:hypothetical protein ABF87_10715 [Nitrosomonas sp. JL21]|uniref:hypothetical protein n=1 Tax=Nitrosomonas sp. JL21 TaxID=153949 RepID=UPI00136EDF23|nr:hypothetical protein [Nitrosomonas sp. JL21]MBL8496786.1 hypothetical protein [Nitrosomonas sp.]MBL8498462.1 hypothetical protein [Nitrosomonas sp.]MXS78421.1 hypothetical protein [Nitrosomonas sp. JL21]
MRRRSKKQDLPKIIALSAVLVACTGAMGYAAFSTFGQPTPDQYGCFEDVKQRNTFVLFDASEPRLNIEQHRSVRDYLDELYANLEFNERLSFITTEGDVISSTPKARFHVCGTAKNPDDLDEIGAQSASAGFLRKQKQRLYNSVYAPQVDEMLSPTPDESRKQVSQSPMLEMVKNVSHMKDFVPGSRLIVLSDLLQNSETAQFCIKQNQMPPFRVFRKQESYQQRLMPRSLESIEVTVLLLQRYGYGHPSYLKYCKNEEELTTFWRDYFTGNGAIKPTFIRIRAGHTAG